MLIHHKTRPIISKLFLPTPIQKYFVNIDWDIDLSSNTNPYMGEFSTYPNVNQEELKSLYLNRILSINPPSFYTKQERESLTSENVLFTAGSMEGLDLLIRTFAEPKKDTICIASPTFSAYEHWALIHGLTVKSIPLKGHSFETIDIESVVQMKPKMVFICNPNNPTGTKINAKIIQDLCDSLDGFVIVDEAYIEFCDEPSSLFYLNKYKNLIILRTFSKAWGLAGVRCGAILADKLIIQAIRYVQLPFSLSSPSQIKIEECLLHPESTFASWERIKKSRADLTKDLLTLQNVVKVYKSSANFMMVVLKDLDHTMTFLKAHRIHVLDCSSSLPHSLRVSLGTESQNDLFFEVLKASSH